jgi:hypothetical protein
MWHGGKKEVERYSDRGDQRIIFKPSFITILLAPFQTLFTLKQSQAINHCVYMPKSFLFTQSVFVRTVTYATLDRSIPLFILAGYRNGKSFITTEIVRWTDCYLSSGRKNQMSLDCSKLNKLIEALDLSSSLQNFRFS